MRSILTVGFMVLSVAAFSFTEERRGPSAEEREKGRACFEEMRSLDCGNSREIGRDEFKACIDAKKGSLSKECQEFHEGMKDRPRHKRGQENQKRDA